VISPSTAAPLIAFKKKDLVHRFSRLRISAVRRSIAQKALLGVLVLLIFFSISRSLIRGVPEIPGDILILVWSKRFLEPRMYVLNWLEF
jgi:hypothetical protein